jgi:hypothetical protein
MDSKELRNLSEAYLEVYQELDEANRAERELKLTPRQREISRNLKDKNTMTKPSRRKPDSDFYNPEKLIPREYDNESDRWHDSMSQSRRLKRNLNKEEVDIYDVILSHLIDEGYASTEEAATAIMVNMSEEWRDSVVEAYKDLPVDKMIRKAGVKQFKHGMTVGSGASSNPKVPAQVGKMSATALLHDPERAQSKSKMKKD